MGVCGGVYTINDLRADINGGVETEGNVRAVDIIVDGLGQSDYVQSFLGEHIRSLVSAVSAEREQAVKPEIFVGLLHLFDLVDVVVLDYLHHLVRRAFCAEDSASRCKDTREVGRRHLLVIAVDKPVIAVVNADDLYLVFAESLISRLCNTADSCVKSRAVAAACKNADFKLCHNNSS